MHVLDAVPAEPEQPLAAAAETPRTIDVGERTRHVRVVVVEEQDVVEIPGVPQFLSTRGQQALVQPLSHARPGPSQIRDKSVVRPVGRLYPWLLGLLRGAGACARAVSRKGTTAATAAAITSNRDHPPADE